MGDATPGPRTTKRPITETARAVSDRARQPVPRGPRRALQRPVCLSRRLALQHPRAVARGELTEIHQMQVAFILRNSSDAYYLGRSHQTNLCHISIPLIGLVVF